MKKVLAALLSMMMLLSLAACGNGGGAASSAAVSSGSSASASALASASAEDSTAVTGDPSAANAFVIWAWNADFTTIQEKVLPKYLSQADMDRIVFVNVGNSDIYQDKIDAILADPGNELYPDIMLLEVGYVQKYVQSGLLKNVADLGITADDMSDMYDYNLNLGADAASGDTYALFWQATPGCWQIRADLAQQYLGTTDPAALQEMFSTWDKVVKVSAQVNDASGGKVKLLSGTDDLKYVFCNGARSQAWYDDKDNIVVDDAIKDYLELSKQLKGLTFDTLMWKPDWAALKDGDGVNTEACIAFTGCPWYSYWCLTDTWTDNTVLIQGPQAFYWGGTGLAATAECSDTQLARDILYYVTCNADSMVEINTANGDYVNNAKAISDIQEHGSGTSSTFKCYNDQDIIGFFADKCNGIHVLAVGEDQVICEQLLPTAVSEYASGSVDLDTAVSNFKSAIHDRYSYLNVG